MACTSVRLVLAGLGLLVASACDGGGGGRADAGAPDADTSGRGWAGRSDAASTSDAVLSDARATDLSGDRRPQDAPAARDAAGDGRPQDAPAARDAAADVVIPPNNGGVTGLTVIAANGTVGLDWPRVAAASGYRIYWADSPGVDKGDRVLESSEPALVHRGLNNGTAYYYAVAALTAQGEGALSAEASATPGGEWVLEELGAGDFDDVVSGSRIPRLAVADRMHVLLFGEGYLASELGKLHDHATHATTRTSDVDRWVDEVFAIEPYKQFRSAFVIWYLPRASANHLGAGATAFSVQIASSGVSTVSAVAAPLWDAVDGRGGDAFPFLPAAPVTNHVAAFLLYDPARGRAGISGLTTSLTSPTNRNQRMPAAFGIGHAHEFTHAFAGLRDEYLETSNPPRSASETGNTSPSNRCDELPWAHLLAGRGINSTEGLVGAFGVAERGFHPELKCLMNGTHDNGQYFCQPAASGGYPNLTLRVNDRLCNFCREIAAYRVFDRTGLLPGSAGFARWKSEYRPRFYQRFGFAVPATVPQTLKCPEDARPRPVFHACVP